MGFAEYLSRNPTGNAPEPSEEDENFVINIIGNIIFALIKNYLAQNGASNYSADEKQVNSNEPTQYYISWYDNWVLSAQNDYRDFKTKKTIICKNVIAIATETKPKPAPGLTPRL